MAILVQLAQAIRGGIVKSEQNFSNEHRMFTERNERGTGGKTRKGDGLMLKKCNKNPEVSEDWQGFGAQTITASDWSPCCQWSNFEPTQFVRTN
ncbi:hypothetical protein C3509_25145 [Salmonella enterica]|nr:hypothetical protein [Salmonella enterica]ECE3295324.1 hypothetical protein [Salmonella enterica]